MIAKDLALGLLAVTTVAFAALLVRERVRRLRARETPAARRILFPFVGRTLSVEALDATLRLARAEGATLVPAYLALVPLRVAMDAAIPRQSGLAMPLLDAIEDRAARRGVAVDSRIQPGRTYRHAMAVLIERERHDRIVAAAESSGADGFSGEDVAWLLEHADGEILVLRPAPGRERRAVAA